MNIAAYMDRIGYHGSLEPTAENLTNILRCHLETVPFENLSCYNNPRELSLTQEDLFDKVVNKRRGGVCFELNGLFWGLLGALGYERYPVGVRILMPQGPSAISHQGNVAVVDGRKYFCDVGFGGPGPKGLVDLETEEIQVIDGVSFRVAREGLNFLISRLHDGQWIPTLRFADVPFEAVDFPFLLFFFSANPKSRFVTNRMVNLCQSDGSLALTDSHLTIRRGGQVIEKDLETEEEVTKVLQEEFGLYL